MFKRGRKYYYQNWYLKTLLNTKRRIHWGEFCLVKGKALETGGENFKSWKCFSKSYWLFAKDFENNFQNICKTKQVVQAWSKMSNKKKAIHAYQVEINIGFIPNNLCTYIMQTSSILHLYICFGLCWHQSPKRGDWKGNRLTPFPKWFWWLNCPTQINWTN